MVEMRLGAVFYLLKIDATQAREIKRVVSRRSLRAPLVARVTPSLHTFRLTLLRHRP